jgi:hypothetical protein
LALALTSLELSGRTRIATRMDSVAAGMALVLRARQAGWTAVTAGVRRTGESR